MSPLANGLAAFRAYVASSDPHAALGNTIAMIVLSNQPFYPLYLSFVLGWQALPALMTWVTVPLFAAVPLIARRDQIAAATLLIMAGIANTTICALAFGAGTLVELFHIPCAVLAAILLRPQRRYGVMAALAGAAILAGLVVRMVPLGGLAGIATDQIASLARINMLSATGLTLAILWLARGLRRAA
jgi:Na+-transporting NADH:ubiquinone oxidoreductase subunit NqrE